VPNFRWRRHLNTGKSDAILYALTDTPLFEKIGQYRAQGRKPDGSVEQLVA
jgi:gentisate 1,2-dioxygenase